MTFKQRRAGSWVPRTAKRREGDEWVPVRPRTGRARKGFDPLAGEADMDWFHDACQSGDIQVVTVTNLDASGEGSLEWAVEDVSGPRLIVFEVGGVIDREVGDYIRPRSGQDDFYIAGQTAPSPGINIIRGQGIRPTDISNVIMQHIRIRPGNETESPQQGDPISLDDCHNVIIDHVSCSWGTNQGFQIRTNTSQVTVTNTMVYETLCRSDHSDDWHCRGVHNQRCLEDIVYLGNVSAHHRRRNPRVRGASEVLWINNYVYNFGRLLHMGRGSTSTDCSVDEPPTVGMMNNVYEKGPDWVDDQEEWGVHEGYLYEEDNLPIPYQDRPVGGSSVTEVDAPPFWPDGLDSHIIEPQDLKATILRNCGARPLDRDGDDERLLQQFVDAEGKWTEQDSQYKVSEGHGYDSDRVYEYPEYNPTYRALHPPSDTQELPEWLDEFTRDVEP